MRFGRLLLKNDHLLSLRKILSAERCEGKYLVLIQVENGVLYKSDPKMRVLVIEVIDFHQKSEKFIRFLCIAIPSIQQILINRALSGFLSMSIRFTCFTGF